jgi:DNA invertase Pin-like site-specific DNA recombinase
VRAHVYLRISEDKTGEAEGVERQQEDCERLVSQRGWTLAAVHMENDTSAAGKVVRPKFAALLAAVERGEVDAIVTWNFDRLLRTPRDRLTLVETCQAHRVIIAPVRGSDMDATTPAGRLALGILGEVAAHEIAVKSDRQRRAARQMAEKGRAPIARRAFGFTPDRAALVPAEEAAIRDAYRDVLAGVSTAAVARRWNAAGLLSGARKASGPHPRPLATWRAETVRALLVNPRNAAIRTLNGEKVGPAAWPAIVPEETFQAVVRMLTDPSRRPAVPVGQRLLSGLATCGKLLDGAACGAHIQAGRNEYHGPTYRCASNGHVARAAAPVDEFVIGLIVERLSRDDAADLLLDDTRPDVDALRTEAQAIRARLDDIAAMLGEGELSREQARTANARARARLAAVEAELADVGRVDVLGDLVKADDVRALWDSSEFGRARQRAVVDTLLTIVLHPPGRGARRFDPATIETTWKIGP